MRSEFVEPVVVDAIASLLTRRGENGDGIAGLAERKDLEPVARAALDAIFPERTEKDRKVPIPGWEHVVTSIS
jgi:hypothetical protein